MRPRAQTAGAGVPTRRDNSPRTAREAGRITVAIMSSEERWMYRIIALVVFSLFAVLAYGHIPRGG